MITDTHESPAVAVTFKTIYFPRERCRSGKSARVTISLPAKPNGNSITEQFIAYARSMSSRDFRLALDDPFLEDLEEQASIKAKSLSDTCLSLLLQHYSKFASSSTVAKHEIVQQLTLPMLDSGKQLDISSPEPEKQNGVNFQESRRQPVHGWYPYVEGFSATYVRDALLRGGTPPRTVYDPFGGAGTTQLVASYLGIKSFYSEINPFMAFVAETKVKAASWARQNLKITKGVIAEFLAQLTPEYLTELGQQIDLTAYAQAFPERDFFEEMHLRHLLAARDLAVRLGKPFPPIESLLLLACAANAVHSSNMTRRADLRRRRADEYLTRVVNVASYIAESIKRMVEDIDHLPSQMAEMVKVSEDCRQIPPDFANSFEMAITSPPYLNGTNYFRNTKIELWLLGYIQSETELAEFCKRAIAAGINNISRSKGVHREFESVEKVARQLDEHAKRL